jgi:hypothetical protein
MYINSIVNGYFCNEYVNCVKSSLYFRRYTNFVLSAFRWCFHCRGVATQIHREIHSVDLSLALLDSSLWPVNLQSAAIFISFRFVDFRATVIVSYGGLAFLALLE